MPFAIYAPPFFFRGLPEKGASSCPARWPPICPFRARVVPRSSRFRPFSTAFFPKPPTLEGRSDFFSRYSRGRDTLSPRVDAALSATGEGANKRPVYGKLLRDLGDPDLFREAVILFAAERRAGDPMRNPAAVLIKKLKQEIADENAARERLAK